MASSKVDETRVDQCKLEVTSTPASESVRNQPSVYVCDKCRKIVNDGAKKLGKRHSWRCNGTVNAQ